VYRLDWAWDRGEEAAHVVFFWWCCAQFTAVVIVPMAWKRSGFWGLAWVLSPAYTYEERHGSRSPDTQVWAVQVIYDYRRWYTRWEHARWMASFQDPPAPDYGMHYVTPLLDRDPHAFDFDRAQTQVLPVVVLEGEVLPPADNSTTATFFCGDRSDPGAYHYLNPLPRRIQQHAGNDDREDEIQRGGGRGSDQVGAGWFGH